jgi:hypothetical protein
MRWQREGGRPPIPRKKPSEDMETEPLVSDHPFVETVVTYLTLTCLRSSCLPASVYHPTIPLFAWCMLFLFNRFSIDIFYSLAALGMA